MKKMILGIAIILFGIAIVIGGVGGRFGFLYIHRMGDFIYRSDLCDCRIFKIR